MSTYSTSAAAPSPSSEVLRAALTTLTNNGFAIENCDDRSASLTGPGMRSTRQNPLLGASKIHLAIDGNQLRLDAELGGVDSMRRFLMRFPFLLGLGLGLLFGVFGGLMFGQQFGVGFGVPWAQGWKWLLFAFGVSMLPVLPWLVISPMMSHMIRNSSETALTNLLKNAVQISKTAQR